MNSTKLYNSRRGVQRWCLEAEPSVVGGKQGFRGGAPDAEAIFTVFFFKKYVF